MSKPINAAIRWLKLVSLQKGCDPRFGHTLQLSYNTIDFSQMAVVDEGRSLQYKYTFRGTSTKPTTSLLLAILDEFTTTTLNAFNNPCPPGVTVHMQLERAVPASQLPDTFTIIANVRKRGRTMAFLDCSFYDEDHKLLAFGNQVKYLPTGSWFLDNLLFSSPLFFNLYCKAFVDPKDPPEYPLVSDVQNIFAPTTCTLESATFQVNPSITNPFGLLHGGAQAMMMERVGRPFAAQIFDTEDIELLSIQVQCLSAGKGTVSVQASLAAQQSSSAITVSVEILRGDKTLTVGYLHFVTRAQSKL